MEKTQFHQFLHVPSCSLKFFDHLGFRALQQAFHLHLPGTLQLFPGGPAGHIVTSHGNHGNPHGHPHGNPQRCGVFSLGSQLETLQETTHLKLLLVKKPRTEVVRWCEIIWDVNFGDVNKIEQVKHVKRYFKTKMCQDVPRCAKMCQDVPRLQLFFHHSYSSFAFLLENMKRSKLRTSCFFTAAVAVPDFCFLMFPSFLDVPSFHWLCSLASSLSAWAFTTLSAQKSEREHREHAAFLPRKHCKSLGFLF